MADAKKCDRCGKYYITNEQEFKGCSLKGRRSNSPSIFFDLCDECAGRLWNFLNYPIETDKNVG